MRQMLNEIIKLAIKYCSISDLLEKVQGRIMEKMHMIIKASKLIGGK